MERKKSFDEMEDAIRLNGLGVATEGMLPESRETVLYGDLMRQVGRNTTLLEQRAALTEEFAMARMELKRTRELLLAFVMLSVVLGVILFLRW